MIREILPSMIACEERFADEHDAWLFPEERTTISGAVTTRQREFATVRHCARLALDRLGYAPAPLVPDRHGAPQWPTGTVGSMTHCAGYRCAAVASEAEVHAVAVDAEPHDPLPNNVVDSIARPDELRRLERLRAADAGTNWDRLLFSCKESVYKAWFPRTSEWLDFDDASVTLDPATRSFSVALLRPGMMIAGRPVSDLSGRWAVSERLVVTSIWILVNE